MNKEERIAIRKLFSQALVERQEASQKICEEIRSSADIERYDAWDRKRGYGYDTRHILLAYGMFKGLPYSAIEKKTREDNPPAVHFIRWYAESVAGIKLGEDVVTRWLGGERFNAAEYFGQPETPPVAPQVSQVDDWKPEPVKPKGGLVSGLKSVLKAIGEAL